jgi:hypothetical protein
LDESDVIPCQAHDSFWGSIDVDTATPPGQRIEVALRYPSDLIDVEWAILHMDQPQSPRGARIRALCHNGSRLRVRLAMIRIMLRRLTANAS